MGKCCGGGLSFDLAQNDQGVIATLDDGTKLHTRYLVGADGIHSTVRESVGIGFPGWQNPCRPCGTGIRSQFAAPGVACELSERECDRMSEESGDQITPSDDIASHPLEQIYRSNLLHSSSNRLRAYARLASLLLVKPRGLWLPYQNIRR